MNSLLELIQDMLLEIYIEVPYNYTQDIEVKSIKQSLYQLKDLYKDLGISERSFTCKFHEFRKYDAHDHIDNEELCEYYLDFYAKFELEEGPGIFIEVILCNQNRNFKKIYGSDILQHTSDLNEYVKDQIITMLSTLVN